MLWIMIRIIAWVHLSVSRGQPPKREQEVKQASTGARDMTDILMQYGLFLAKALTVVVLAWAILAIFVSMSHRRSRPPERLEVKSLNEKYEEMSDILKEAMLSKKQFKRVLKERKARRQAEEKKKQAGASKSRKRIFVLNFRGDIKATAVSSLREEVTAVLTMATPEDEVLLRLENSGGLVH